MKGLHRIATASAHSADIRAYINPARTAKDIRGLPTEQFRFLVMTTVWIVPHRNPTIKTRSAKPEPVDTTDL